MFIKNESMDDLSTNLLAKRFYKKCTPKCIKCSMNLPKSSSESVGENEMKND